MRVMLLCVLRACKNKSVSQAELRGILKEQGNLVQSLALSCKCNMDEIRYMTCLLNHYTVRRADGRRLDQERPDNFSSILFPSAPSISYPLRDCKYEYG